MKIALIIKRLNTKGGAQRQFLKLAHELKKRGYEIKLYTFQLDKKECFEKLFDGLDVVALSEFKPPPYQGGAIAGPLSYVRVVRYENNAAKKLALMIDPDTDLLHPHDHVAYRVSVYFKKYIKNSPSVWMLNDMPTRMWAFWREQECRPEMRLAFIKKIFYWLTDLYEIHIFIKSQDAIAVVDFRDEKWVKEYFDKKAFVVRTGLDIKQLPYRERPSLQKDRIRLLATGIFFVHRRFEDSIEAVKKMRDTGYNTTLSIIGNPNADKNYYEYIKNQIKNLELEQSVFLLGVVEEQELLQAYYNHDIFVFPNHLQSWGLAVFEAMATGLPVIVSKSAGASEVLKDNETALLVEPKHPYQIAQAVKKLVDNPVLYGNLSRQGRKFVEENISWGRYADQMIQIFQKTVDNQSI